MNFIYRSYCNPKLCVETNGKRCCHHCALSQPMLLINLSFRLSQNWTREISLFSPPKGGDQPFPSPLRKSGKFLSLNGFGGGGTIVVKITNRSPPSKIWGGGLPSGLGGLQSGLQTMSRREWGLQSPCRIPRSSSPIMAL
jgi:hypothetical protein